MPVALPSKSRVSRKSLKGFLRFLIRRIGRTGGDKMRKKPLFKGCAAMALFIGPAIASADVISDWNAIMLTTVSGQSPFAQARFAAITQLAVFEGVNAITGAFKPYLGTIHAPSSASAEAAAIAAAHTVLKNYFSANSA